MRACTATGWRRPSTTLRLGRSIAHSAGTSTTVSAAAPFASSLEASRSGCTESPNLVASSLGYNNLDQQGDRAWRMEWFHATPCCTGNQARLLPNYIHHTWMGTPDGGLAATMYAPVTVRSSVGDVTVEISSKTSYPFEDTAIMDVTVVDSKTKNFPLWLRIPAWW